MIVDLGCVEPGDGQGRKEGGKQASAHLGKLVEDVDRLPRVGLTHI